MKKRFLIYLSTLLLFISALNAQPSVNQLDESGKKHGLWKGRFPESQRVKYEGTFDHGKEIGVFTFYDDTKAHTIVATRDFSKAENGAYTTFYDSKKNVVSEGNVVNHAYIGPWKYYHQASKQVMTVEHYANGILNGVRQVYYPDGTLAEEVLFVNGKKNGLYRKYSLKGKPYEEVTYKDDLIEGYAKYNDSDGNVLSQGTYKNGLKNGVWEFYDKGKLVRTEKHPLVKKFVKRKLK